MSVIARDKPLLIWDGECRFCRRWIEHWQRLTGDSVEYATYQDVADQFPDITAEQFAKSVHLIHPDGTIDTGARAVFETLSDAPGQGWWLSLYRYVPGFSRLSERVYRTVAAHRNLANRLTSLLWGDLGPHSHSITRWLFLRALGLIYFIAFWSLHGQILGLVGSHGILPTANFLDAVTRTYPEPVWNFPTLAWLNSSDAFLQFLTGGGMVLAGLMVLNLVPRLTAALCWLFYLSVVTVGQVFLGFQWDGLLLETGFLAIFLAPGHVLPLKTGEKQPSLTVIWLYRFLVFRVMFSSGAVKLLSGDPTWHNLTALNYNYFTQPIPNVIAWYMHQLPEWFQQLSVLFTLTIELLVPFLIFAPRRLRFVAGWLIITLMTLILLTGNYTFFNYLTIALCLLLFDDAVLKRLIPTRWRSRFAQASKPRHIRFYRRIPVLLLAALILFLGGFRLIVFFIPAQDLPRPAINVALTFVPSRIVNHYGLFAQMTIDRPEIIIEGSHNGTDWEAYSFHYKVGDEMRPPPWVAPFHPRLDWQMWFAALGSPQQNRWFINLVARLLEGEPQVLALLEHNPFPDEPPRLIRARLYDYTFTDAATRAETGAWWQRESRGLYLPPVNLESLGG